MWIVAMYQSYGSTTCQGPIPHFHLNIFVPRPNKMPATSKARLWFIWGTFKLSEAIERSVQSVAISRFQLSKIKLFTGNFTDNSLVLL